MFPSCRLYGTVPLWGAVSLRLLSPSPLPGSLSVCLSVFLHVRLSRAHSIICGGCGPLLCMLKAQLGSQNPLDWCSVASVFHSSVAWTRPSGLGRGGGESVCACDVSDRVWVACRQAGVCAEVYLCVCSCASMRVNSVIYIHHAEPSKWVCTVQVYMMVVGLCMRACVCVCVCVCVCNLSVDLALYPVGSAWIGMK